MIIQTLAPDDDDLFPKVAGGELHQVAVAVGIHGRQRETPSIQSRDPDILVQSPFPTTMLTEPRVSLSSLQTDQLPGDVVLFVTDRVV